METSNPTEFSTFEIDPALDLLEDDLFSEFIEYPPVSPETIRHSGFISFAEYNSAPTLPVRSHQPQVLDRNESPELPSRGNDTGIETSSKAGKTPQRRSKPRTTAPYPILHYPGQGLLALSGAAAPTRKPRSCFTPGRRKEVRDVRDRGACLRCTLLKRRCSGGDPCDTCLHAASTAVKSKALTWMECVRPSFETVNVFQAASSNREKQYLEMIAKTFTDVNLRFDLNVPFHVEMQRLYKQFAHLIMKDGVVHPRYEYRIASISSVAVYSNMMRPLLGTWIGRYAKSFLHLSVHLSAVELQAGFRDYPVEDILRARSHLARVLLVDLERLLKPGKLETLKNKLQILRALFLVLVVAIIAMRYRAVQEGPEVSQETKEAETKDQALERLLWHYLVYIGISSSLLEPEMVANDSVNQVTFFTPATSLKQFRTIHEKPSKPNEPAHRPSATKIDNSCFFCRPVSDTFQLTHNSNDLRSARCCSDCQNLLKEFDAKHSHRKKQSSGSVSQREEFTGQLTSEPYSQAFDLRSGFLSSRFLDEFGSESPLSEERPEELGWTAFRLCCMHHCNGGDAGDPCRNSEVHLGGGHVLFNPGFVNSEEG